MRLFIIAFCFELFICHINPLYSLAQSGIAVSGIVINGKDRVPLEGVKIHFKGTSSFVFTNSDGNFIITGNLTPPGILQFSISGYQTKEITINHTFLFETEVTMDPLGISVSGKIISSKDDSSLPGVSILVKGTHLGSASDSEGRFALNFQNHKQPIILQFSMMGFKKREINVTDELFREVEVIMDENPIWAEEIIITALKVDRKIFTASKTIEKLHIQNILEIPVASTYDVIANLKSIFEATQSLQFKSYNVRGFNSTGNTRFLQLIDGIDNQAPGFNFPIGNIAGITDLDLESYEILPGPSTVQYGPNALNGMLLINSKSPFEYQGLSISSSIKANHIGFGRKKMFEFNLKPILDFGLRYAKVINNKFAYKISASYMNAEDWHANDTTNINLGSIRFEEDPGYDGLNRYGDEITAELPLGQNNTLITVARSGYNEENLIDYDIYNFKINGAIHYRFKPKLTAIFSGNYGIGTTVYTGDNRVLLDNFGILQGKAEIKGENFFLRGYNTNQFSGDSYDTRFLAIHLNRSWKSDEDWFRHYLLAYNGWSALGLEGGSDFEARRFADSNFGNSNSRAEPGSSEFEREKSRIINKSGFKEGAKIVNNSALYHIEGNYKLNNLFGLINTHIGGNFRYYDLESNGTLFADTTSNDITNFEYGFYTLFNADFLNQTLKLSSSIRYDRNENFTGNISPGISAALIINKNQTLRMSFMSGVRNPNIKEQFIKQDLGYIRIIGGYPEYQSSLMLQGNSFFQKNVELFQYAVRKTLQDNGYDINYAQYSNLNILENGILDENDLKQLVSEKIRTFELGYKQLFSQKVFINFAYFHNLYENFIGIARVVKTNTSPGIDLYAAALQTGISSQNQVYHLYTNSKEKVTVQGLSTEIKATFPDGSILDINGTWTKLQTDIKDPVIPGFNTPEYKISASYLHRQVFKNVGFSAIWRWQSPFDWESSFGDGEIKGINIFDIQFSYMLERYDALLNVGVTNFFNIGYINNFGGPEIGSLIYASIRLDLQGLFPSYTRTNNQ